MNQPKNDTLSLTDNMRIDSITETITPKQVIESYPLDDEMGMFIDQSRKTTSDIINKRDDKLAIVVGPCSIHDPEKALEYADFILEMQKLFPHLYLIMRVYFEKPRTTVGWKGLINDPHLDGSHDINTGYMMGRRLLHKITQMNIPVAVEFLDTIGAQYVSDLVNWGAIGARTSESQEHRKMASGLSMPVGFKNGTYGNIDIAIDGIGAASQSHAFQSVTKEGKVANVITSGNEDSHIILRGGKSMTNFSSDHISETSNVLKSKDIHTGIMVDVSHANCEGDYMRQVEVAEIVANQIAQGNKDIVALMIESNLVAGKQKFNPVTDDKSKLIPGQSITDGCIDLDDTKQVLRTLNKAAEKRNGVLQGSGYTG